MTLSCGGKGPCCHVGYSHRHCEHCDLVIDTRQYVALVYPWWQQPYPAWQYPLTQPFHAFNTFGDVGNAINTVSTTTVPYSDTHNMQTNYASAALASGV